MKKFTIKYIYQECNTLEEYLFRISQLKKYGFKWFSSGQSCIVGGNKYYFIASDVKIKAVSTLLQELRKSKNDG